MVLSVSTIPIAGIEVYVHTKEKQSAGVPIACLFVLHGRLSKARKLDSFIENIFQHLAPQPGAQRDLKELVVVTFDHRNHGSRLLHKLSNQAWDSDVSLHNPKHAVDMYAVQTGSASDVSFLIDFLPAYLFPNEERQIVDWGVLGISLGGHSTWIAIKNDPRLSLGIPIIGCPDFLALMKHRCEVSNLPMESPHFPASLRELVSRSDPTCTPYREVSPANPYLNKRILVLSGGADPLVPWSASEAFVTFLEVGKGGVKEFLVEEGAGHEVTENMVIEASRFIKLWLALTDSPSTVRL